MKIKIDNANVDKINKAIEEAEGYAKVRTIDAEDVFNAVKEVEKHFGIPAKHMIGIKVEVDLNAQSFPNAYKYVAESTHFYIDRTASGWFLTSVWRGKVNAPSRQYVLAKPLTDEQKTAILKRFDSWA